MREKPSATAPILALVFAALAIACAVVTAACTTRQRAIVHDVTQLVEDVCGDADTVETCLGKVQAARAAARSPDAGASAP